MAEAKRPKADGKKERRKKRRKTKREDLPPELAHDDREIDVHSIVRFGMLVAAFTAVAMSAMWVFDRYLTRSETSTHVAPPPIASVLPKTPAEPKLQRAPREGLARLRAEEDAQLSSYGWVDRDKGKVQIPIDRAMRLLSRRGLPARRSGPKVKSPTSRPSEGGLGIQKQDRRRGGRR